MVLWEYAGSFRDCRLLFGGYIGVARVENQTEKKSTSPDLITSGAIYIYIQYRERPFPEWFYFQRFSRNRIEPANSMGRH